MTLILGRKRGMTQLFAEDGTVHGRDRRRGGSVRGHAGPHPGDGRLRRRAARLRGRARQARRASRSAATSRRSASRPSASCARSAWRGRPTRRGGRHDHAPTAFERRRRRRRDRHHQGPRLRRHDQAPRLPPRPRDARLHERAPARLDRPPAHPASVLKGKRMAGHFGADAPAPPRTCESCASTPSATCCSSRVPCRARTTASSRSSSRPHAAPPAKARAERR